MNFTNLEAALENPLVVKKLHLVKQEGVKKNLKRILELCNLEELHIQSCTMSSIPAELWQLSQLKSLTLIDCGHKLEEYPPEIGLLSSLETLCLGKQFMQTLPESIGNLTQLKSLQTKDLFLNHLPKSLSKLKNLKKLEILDAYLKHLPNSIKELVDLEHLALHTRIKGEVKPFPDDFFEGFKRLKRLSLVDCDITFFPESIASLSTLEYLNLNENSFLKFPISLLKLTQLGEQLYIRYNKHYAYGTPIDLNQANTLKLVIEKYDIGLEEASCYFGCLEGNRSSTPEVNPNTLLAALTQPDLPDILRINALDSVDFYYEKNPKSIKLAPNHQLAILGKYKFTKKDLKICSDNKITILGEITDTIPENCSHILVAKGIPTTRRLTAGSCQLITPKNFIDWLNSEKDLYLLDESDKDSPQMQENVLQLLDSADEENIKVALALMKDGGVPKAAISLLFIMAKMDYDPLIKRKAKKLVLPMLSSKASENFKIRGSFKTSPDIPALIRKLTGRIESEINKDVLYKYAYQRFGPNENLIAYLFCSQDESIRQIAWNHTCKGNTIVLYETWGLPSGDTATQDIAKLQHIEELVLIGNDADPVSRILTELKKIRCVRLLETKFTTWSSYDIHQALSGFEQLSSLEISLSDNYESLSSLFQLASLEELYLSEMSIYYKHEPQLEQLPTEILNLKKLKTLSINHKYANIQNLEIISELSSLEHLSLENCPVETIPLALGKLKKLKTLNLRNTKIKAIPKELQAQFVNCTILI